MHANKSLQFSWHLCTHQFSKVTRHIENFVIAVFDCCNYSLRICAVVHILWMLQRYKIVHVALTLAFSSRLWFYYIKSLVLFIEYLVWLMLLAKFHIKHSPKRKNKEQTAHWMKIVEKSYIETYNIHTKKWIAHSHFESL